MARKVNKRKRQELEPKDNRPTWLRVIGRIWIILWSALKVALGVAGTALLVVAATGVVFACMMGSYLQDDVIPDANFDPDAYDMSQTSFIYYQDKATGEIRQLQQIYTSEDRVVATYDEIPEDMVNAAIAIEDRRFREHQGVDWFRTVRACITMFLGGDSSFGGSSITQQLIKNVTQENDVTVRRKVMEIFRALQFEKRYSKEEIMTMYLNRIYLGEGCYGVKSAARVYFGKDISQLTTAECASIIGITNNPSMYDPYISMKNNRKRQLTILNEMLEQEMITQEEYDEAVAQKMVFKNSSGQEQEYTCPNCGYIGTEADYDYSESSEVYTCPVCGGEMPDVEKPQPGYSWFVDLVLEDVVRDLSAKTGFSEKACYEMIKTGGYHIYSTIDMSVQNELDKIYQNLDEIPKTKSIQQLQSAMVIVDNTTGDVVAVAGGVGEKTGYRDWSRASTSKLQTGSSMKPLSVYAPALEVGAITPATVIMDGPLYFQDNGSGWPQNDSRTYSGPTTVLRGVTSSLNAVAVNVLEKIGTEYSFDFAKDKFRLSTLVDSVTINEQEKSDIGYAPLGMGALTYGATVRDMTSAYATFANDGVWREGRSYTIVYDGEGNVVLDNRQESEQILSHKSNTYMSYMLQRAVEGGTGTPAQISGMAVAGKTGTTSDNKDRWFAGYTGYYTAVVWCGYDNPEQVILTEDWRNPAAVLWRKVMSSLHEGKENKSLYNLSDFDAGVSVCLDSGKIATEACSLDVRSEDSKRVMYVPLFSEDYPTNGGRCDKHVMVEYCTGGKAIANEYCSKFPDNEVTKSSQVKFTKEELEYFEKAKIKIPEECIYQEDDKKKVCTVHTKEAYEALTKPTEPTVPTDPRP